MAQFRVWLRPLGNSARVRVEGRKNVDWLLQRLSQSFIFKTSEPIGEELDGTRSTFLVSYGSDVTRASFEKLMRAIPEVQLMAEPA